MGNKSKKEKITYVDDGRTLADMSNVPKGAFSHSDNGRPPIRFRDAWHTFWDSFKMMLLPALVFAAGLGLLYLLMWLLFTLL